MRSCSIIVNRKVSVLNFIFQYECMVINRFRLVCYGFNC